MECGICPQTEGFPWDDLRKIFLQMAKVPNAVEILPKITIG